jgi:hypothetical protein
LRVFLETNVMAPHEKRHFCYQVKTPRVMVCPYAMIHGCFFKT